MSELKPKQNISIEIVSGVEGLCLIINDYRVAGPKPWGGGAVTHSFKAKLDDIERAVYGSRRTQHANEPLTLEQLLEMDGEPVWLKDGIGEGWFLASAVVGSKIYFCEKSITVGEPISECGKTWLAYRRPPEMFIGVDLASGHDFTAYGRPPERSENDV